MVKSSFQVKLVVHLTTIYILTIASIFIQPYDTPVWSAPQPNWYHSSLHLTSQSVIPGYAVKILAARSTTKMIPSSSRIQIIEATIENIGTMWFTPTHPTIVVVQANGIRTKIPAVISELAPNEQATVEVGIQKSPSIPDGTQISRTVVAMATGGNINRFVFTPTIGIPQYNTTSLSQHETPDWFNNAKFGIFIHWGIYSVPAWAPVGKEYAEWYWNYMHDKQNPIYQHQLQTYGPNVDYDNFIPQFTAANFNPKAWVQLFKQAGAKYFVLVSKHHDGFALFQTQYSHRKSV